MRFSLAHRLQPGSSIHVVGSLSELSAWSPREAPRMSWQEDQGAWTLDVEFPPGPFAFKVRGTHAVSPVHCITVLQLG